jgi:hypothetical protein
MNRKWTSLFALALLMMLSLPAAAQSHQWTGWGGVPQNSGGGNDVIYANEPNPVYFWLRHGINLVTGKRGNSNPAMLPILSNFSADDKRAVAAYMAQLPAPGKATTR